MYTKLKISDLIEKLNKIRDKEGNLPVLWGDGYFEEHEIDVMVLGLAYNAPSTRRVCISRDVGGRFRCA